MKKTIKVRAETLEQARKKLKEDLPGNVFISKIIDEFESRQPSYKTEYITGDSVEEAIEKAKEKLPDPYFIKGEPIPELELNTNLKIPVLIQAENDWQAGYLAETYIEDRFFSNASFGTAKQHYSILDNQLEKKNFKGIFGIGKQDDTYKLTFLIKPRVTLKYSMWSYAVAEISDDMDILNGNMIECAKRQAFDEVKRFIEQGADINHCDKDGRNILFYFCNNHKHSEYLLAAKIDFRKLDNFGDNILSYAARTNCNISETLKQFLDTNGIKVNPDIKNEKMLECAKQRQFNEVKKLIEQGADINFCDKNGENALFYTYSDSNWDEREISAWLIDRGIDYKKCDNAGDNILTYVLRNRWYLDPHRLGSELRTFLEKNGVNEDEKLIKEIRETEAQEEEDSKVWCSKCNKKVLTVEDGYYYDDGWMKDVDIKCEKCGEVLDHYRGQA